MKNMLWVLLVALFVPAVQAAPLVGAAPVGRREAMVRRYAPKVASASALLKAAEEGNLAAIGTLEQISFLQETDKFGNNCFHLAKDAATVQALAAAMRRLDDNFLPLINALRNQRNTAGETPLMRHINYGKADTFRLLYEGTELASAVREARRVDIGGALRTTADIKKGVAVSLSKDNSGRTVAQAAQANHLQNIVQFFEEQAPYLF